jgi:glycosyltransferase involved in cell wall biosynthesis
MKQQNNSGQLNTVVVYTAYSWVHALTTLRIVRPIQLAGMQLIHGNDLDIAYPENVSQGDVIVFQRDFPASMELYEQILTQARAENKPVIYEIDDLLFELPDEHPDRSIEYYTPALFAMLRAVIEADLVTTTTPSLAEYLRPFNPNIYVLPNYLDDGLWTLKTPGENTGKIPVIIGYMGSNTHAPDLEEITPVILTILERFGEGIVFRFWGGEPPQAIRDHPQVKWTPLAISNYPDFAAYFSEQECDIYIGPLKDTHFNRCKSQIKFLEYSSHGAPGVYSKVSPYKSVIQHGENGFLASTLDEWGNCLVRLIEDAQLRHEMGMKALKSVKEDWLLSKHASEWKQAYEQAKLITTDEGAKGIKGDYTNVFIQVAKQVRDWQINLQDQLNEKEQANLQLQAELDEIKSSNAWQVIQKAWKLKTKLIPPDSNR